MTNGICSVRGTMYSIETLGEKVGSNDNVSMMIFTYAAVTNLTRKLMIEDITRLGHFKDFI